MLALTHSPVIVFASRFFLVAGLLFATSCDFGNKSNDVRQEGVEEEGTHIEGDNADDSKPDTTGTSAFQK